MPQVVLGAIGTAISALSVTSIISFVAKTVVGLAVSQSFTDALPPKPRRR